MIDIREHGGNFGGASKNKKFVKKGELANILFNTSYHRFVIAGKYLYSKDDTASPYIWGIYDLDTNSEYARITDIGMAHFRADSLDNFVYGRVNSVFGKYNRDLVAQWTYTFSGSIYWSATALDEDYFYYVGGDAKLYRINRQTGQLEGVTTSAMSGGNAGVTTPQKKTNRMVYMLTTTSYSYFTLTQRDNLSVLRNFTSNVGGTNVGAFLSDSGNTLYAFHVAGDSYIYVTVYDMVPTTPTIIQQVPIALYSSSSIIANTIGGMMTDQGYVINAGNTSLLFTPDSVEEWSYHIKSRFQTGYHKINEKRFVAVNVQKTLTHGTYE